MPQEPPRLLAELTIAFSALETILTAPAPAKAVPMTASRTPADKEWKALYTEYCRVERAGGYEPASAEAFRELVSREGKRVLTQHGCKLIAFSIVSLGGRAHVEATPVRTPE